jgi:hypothetical protein
MTHHDGRSALVAAGGAVERSLSAEESTSALAIQQHQLATGLLRRGSFVILPPQFSFIWRIRTETAEGSDE